MVLADIVAKKFLRTGEQLIQDQVLLASIHKTLPRYRVEDFLTATQFAPEGEKLLRLAAIRIAKA